MTEAEFLEMAHEQDTSAVEALQMLPSVMRPSAWFELHRVHSNVDAIVWHLANPEGDPLCDHSVIEELAEIGGSIARVAGVLRQARI